MGATGEYADFQELSDIVKSYVTQEECRRFGDVLSPSEVCTLVKRILYNRRTDFKPLFVKVVIAGVTKESSFLAVVDMYGTSWEDDYVTTGIAMHMKGLQLDQAVGKSRDEVIKGILDVWRALKVRYVLAVSEFEVLDVKSDGIASLDKVKVPAGYQICEGTWDKEEIVLQ